MNHEAGAERMKLGSTAAPCVYLRLPRVILGSAAAKQETLSHRVQGEHSVKRGIIKITSRRAAGLDLNTSRQM